ncbi:MAG: hypothetical protein Q9220_005626 [cf. Caloplaca sp. 1 TL-2023]
MSGSDESKKLLKNPNYLKEAVDHLRPRGSYDPLPPPGGYPLPAYIRRKFSFAPQLANMSMLSLMPDFASSSLDLNLQLNDSDAKKISHETPVSLRIRYSLESLPKDLESEKRLTVRTRAKSTLPRINTTVNGIRDPYHRPFGDVARQPDRGSEDADHTNVRPSKSLRRVHGFTRLRPYTPPSSDNDTVSTFHTIGTYDESSEPFTPGTMLSSIDFDVDDVPSEVNLIDASHVQLTERLARETPNLFGSFCIIDLQLDGNPVRVTSQDMLPADLSPDESLFLAQDETDVPFTVKTTSYSERSFQTLPIEGDLLDIRQPSPRLASHRFVGQIDLTDFFRNELETNSEDEDVWLMIAYEEMEKAGTRRTIRKPKGHDAGPIDQAEQTSEAIQSLHRDYFVVGISRRDKQDFSITMVSPTLSASQEVQRPGFLDFAGLRSCFSRPERFVTRVKWHTPGRRDKLYCIPLCGPELVCWLCFLVDKNLPDLWPIP